MKIEFSSQKRNAFVLDHQHGRREVTCKPAVKGTNSYIATIGVRGRCQKGRERDFGQELGLGFIINESSELLYGYMTCDLRLFVNYPLQRPLTRLRLAINLIPLSALNFDFLH